MTTRRGLFGLMAGAAIAPFVPPSPAAAAEPLTALPIGDIFTISGVHARNGWLQEFIVTGQSIEMHSWRDGAPAVASIPLSDFYAPLDTS